MRQLGKAIGIVAMATVREIIMHEDVSAWGAPSECHRDVRRGEVDRERTARRHAKAVSGLTRGQFRRALRAFGARRMERVVGRLNEKHNPFVRW